MDLVLFQSLVFFNIHDYSVNSPQSRDDDIVVLLSPLCCRILVRECCECAHCISSCLHYPNVGRGLLVEQHTVDH